MTHLQNLESELAGQGGQKRFWHGPSNATGGSPNLKRPARLTKSRWLCLRAVATNPTHSAWQRSYISKGAVLDLIGSDELDCPEFHGKPGLNFLNLRGDQRSDVSLT